MDYTPGTERFPRDEDVCALVQDLLPLYLDDEVNPRSRAMIVAHLNECAHCAGFLAGARSTREQLGRERGRGEAPHSSVLNAGLQAIPFTIGISGLVATAILAIALAAYGFSNPFSLFLLQIGSGSMIHAVFLLTCVGAIGMLSQRLLQPRGKTGGIGRIVLGGLVLGIVALFVPFADPIYSLVGWVTLALAGSNLWREWRGTHITWTMTKGKYVAGLVLATIALTILLTFTRQDIQAVGVR